MLRTYSVQALSLFWALSLASPVPAPAAAPTPGPVLSNVTAHDLGMTRIPYDNLPVKVQYYTDYGCTKYNTEFVLQAWKCYNYSYTGTHSANALYWPDRFNKEIFYCSYYSGKDCQGSRQSFTTTVTYALSIYGVYSYAVKEP
ncbi:uncharacterized protein B0I36DRAFT_361462 [Microdochium trichocladiopsis]|uniref:Secreted protein n=1 Tax=Microdochium trichocladiopsis TaxID=1682393 RepID=A0A9P8Y5Y4_9PEZI|nr:uncharacterized protein B0I36DRAFT_361462 [Microdochium trichocladiopsis]KAH7032685.1 hypothetical protein B0I36DRAFT_361462 [Microdochium trichocladiopsis]